MLLLEIKTSLQQNHSDATEQCFNTFHYFTWFKACGLLCLLLILADVAA